MEVFRHTDFDPAFTAHLELYLQLRSNGFTYACTEPDSNRLMLLNNLDLSGEISDPDEKRMIGELSKEDLVFLPAARRTVIWSHLPFSLFPAEIGAGDIEKQASLLLDLSGQQICQDRYNELVVAFALPVNIYSRYRDLFPGAVHRHLAGSLLSSNAEDHVIHMVIQEHLVLLSVRIDGKLHLANSYRFQTTDEFLYFLLLATEQTGFDRENGSVILSGQVAEDGKLFQETAKFFNHIRLETSELWPDTADHETLPQYFTPLLKMMS
ncbi:MAG TPA: DUF3822 family protein [Chitinophagales bacterium]|nr:DUF3822 family protein [Chitinophagales bacterium]